jgi:hypothetical protein
VTADLARTCRSLHVVAELVLAGPQYRAHRDIRLQVRPGGFGTVAGPDVRVNEASVVRDDVIAAIDGATPAAIAKQLGLQASGLEDVYRGGTNANADEKLAASTESAAYLVACYAAGDAGLAQFAPDAERVLWPEHFDVGIRVDDVNYGVSTGDETVAEPYAYVGPDEVPDAPFWNAPFGAVLRLGTEPAADAIAEFFTHGRDALRG